MGIVDKLSAVDVNAATGADDLARALRQTASSAKIAGKVYARTYSNIWVA